ncbi:hemerythrin domain-containing protein [Streptomyces canus]|uniref:hemerythrin domain-containing protein n=1 Tax=Streptomyces canus TaxID=58343 RepID=UPI0036F144CD
MCEYCGCQSLASIDELTREHDEVVRLISRLRSAQQSGDVARMAELAREIAAVLGPHTQVEEHGLFPAMAEDFPEQIAALEAEHRRIEVVLAEAADGTTPTDPAWPDRLMDAMAMLRDHILKEQDGVFPAALAGLSTEEWEYVEATRARAGSALPRPTV